MYRCPFPNCNKWGSWGGGNRREFAWKSNLNVHLHTHDSTRRKWGRWGRNM